MAPHSGQLPPAQTGNHQAETLQKLDRNRGSRQTRIHTMKTKLPDWTVVYYYNALAFQDRQATIPAGESQIRDRELNWLDLRPVS